MPEIEISADKREEIIDWIGKRNPARHIIGNQSDGRESFIIEGEPVIFYRRDDQNVVSMSWETIENLKFDVDLGDAYKEALKESGRLIKDSLTRLLGSEL